MVGNRFSCSWQSGEGFATAAMMKAFVFTQLRNAKENGVRNEQSVVFSSLDVNREPFTSPEHFQLNFMSEVNSDLYTGESVLYL